MKKDTDFYGDGRSVNLDAVGAEMMAIARELELLQKRLARLVNRVAGCGDTLETRLFSVLFREFFEEAPGAYLMQGETTGWLDSRITTIPRLLEACKTLGFIPGTYKCRFMRNFRAWLASRPGVQQVQYAINDRRFLGITRRYAGDVFLSKEGAARLAALCDEILQGGADETEND